MPTPRRSDARRNRAAILRAATEAICGGSTAISAPSLARAAGVGQATVYRHFPDRGALVLAVLAEQLARLRALVGATTRQPAAFRPILATVLHAQVGMRPLVALVRELPPPEQKRYLERLVAVLSGPFTLSQDAGLLRPDLRPADLELLLTMVQAAVDASPTGPDHPARVHRMIEALLDGLFIPPSPPGPPTNGAL